MNTASELSISPALLQAISETLNTKEKQTSSEQNFKSTSPFKMNPTVQIKEEISDSIEQLEDLNSPEDQFSQPNASPPSPRPEFPNNDTVGHILSKMNEPVADIIQPSTRQIPSVPDQGQSSVDDEETTPSDETQNAGLSQEEIKNLLKWKINQQAISLGDGQQEFSSGVNGKGDNLETIIISRNSPVSTEPDMSMVNVLTSIAMQHLKTSNINSAATRKTVSSRNEVKETNILPSSETEDSPQVIICYKNDNSAPSPVHDVVVSDTGSVMIDNTGQRYYIQDADRITMAASAAKQAGFNNAGQLIISDLPQSLEGGIDLSLTNKVEASGNTSQDPMDRPCPVCGDGISGYHYGIFTCESCKGFFKRTVQNKKVFSCHQSGGCKINRANRKKCPACRFTKCIVMGMKTEAIRLDRTRGGRSSYEGCSPHGRTKIVLPKKQKQIKQATPRPKQEMALPKNLENVHVTLPTGEDLSGSHLVAILNKSGKQLSQTVKPFVPTVLTEIMNMESFLCEDENGSELQSEKITDSDPNVFMSLLQVAELRLYKLVRWARNLPQFSTIATDDQILLLQNSWADILILNCCMRSIQSTTEICLPFGQTIDMERAEKLGYNVGEIVYRMLNVTENLRRLQVDQYEFVALKVMILITPDIKGMKEPHRASQHQEIVSDALKQYTESHYPQMPSKYGELLLRLPEIARLSMTAKDSLNNFVPPNFQSCGLLFELLKGDAGKEDT